MQALAAVIAFLLDRGVPTELVEPLTVALFSIVDRNLRERHVGMDGPKPRPMAELLLKASAAAKITIFKESGVSLDDAIAQVSKTSGLSKRELKSLRNRISRKRAGPDLIEAYNGILADLREMLCA